MISLFIPPPIIAALMRIWYEESLHLLFNPFGLPTARLHARESGEGDLE